MIERFTGPDGPRLVRLSLIEQQCVAHDKGVADELFSVHSLVVFKPGDEIVTQGAHDNDIYLIFAGSASIRVNGRELAIRGANQHVGEMSLIEPSAKRSATIVALEATVAAKISEPEFARIAERHPELWRRLAIELGQRLRQRSQYVRAKNPRPVVFVGCSVEGLAVAKEIQVGLTHLPAVVYLWTNNVFKPGHYAMEDLEQQVSGADFCVVVWTPDDQIENESRGIDTAGPRDNCVLELGMGLGAMGRVRTYLVKPRGVELKIPTDFLGITPIEYDASGDPKHLPAMIGPVCTAIEKAIREMGSR